MMRFNGELGKANPDKKMGFKMAFAAAAVVACTSTLLGIQFAKDLGRAWDQSTDSTPTRSVQTQKHHHRHAQASAPTLTPR